MITIATTGLEDYLEGGKAKVKILLAGLPGAGKTRSSSYSPRPIYAFCEDGMMSVADRRVPYGRVRTEKDMVEFLDMLKAECRRPVDQRRWETVVIDTLDAWQRSIIQDYLAKKKQTELSGFEDWGWLDSVMTSFVDSIMELDMNVIVLCHTKDKSGGKTGPDITELKLKGDVKVQLPADFDFVGMFANEFGDTEDLAGLSRWILWRPTPKAAWLKSRGGALFKTPVTFSEEDWSSIREGIRKAAEGLQAAETIGNYEIPDAPQAPTHRPVAPGGPVGNGTGRPAVPPAPRPAATPAPGHPAQAQPGQPTPTLEQLRAAQGPAQPPTLPQGPATPPAPPVVAPPPAAPRPAPMPSGNPVTPAEAVETVKEVLGGKVVEDTAGEFPATPVADPTPELPGKSAAEVYAEHETKKAAVADQAPAETPAVEEAPAAPEGPAEVPQDAEVYQTYCGAPRFTGANPPEGIGCGQPLTVSLSGNRIVRAEEGQDSALMDIAGLRKRAFLHNACSTTNA